MRDALARAGETVPERQAIPTVEARVVACLAVLRADGNELDCRGVPGRLLIGHSQCVARGSLVRPNHNEARGCSQHDTVWLDYLQTVYLIALLQEYKDILSTPSQEVMKTPAPSHQDSLYFTPLDIPGRNPANLY